MYKLKGVNGEWSGWGSWGVCDQTCGQGTQRRSRTCSSPPPSEGGRNCTGSDIGTRSCNIVHCPINGEWSGWGSWGVCDQTCGQGTQRRSRTCSSPPPSEGGRNCTGSDIGTRSCNIVHCPSNGGWGQWSDWFAGCGSQTRTRACDNPTPEFGAYADCSEIHKAHPDLPSSIYTITTWNTSSQAKVVCDMDTDGGGWTVFQHRVNGSVDFYRNFSSYEAGFGSPSGEFWLGLSLMHEMTSRTTNELRIDIQRANGGLGYVVYPKFRIEAAPTYILRIGTKTDYGGS
ncbi:coadhesin-like [Mya arenaria]|uniref:coadhesin-like n=1 Tax=Mya arenaria TaxID=6604 RepID=UPI0022E10C93|nr:coadhesin-like [Mya arenaria]